MILCFEEIEEGEREREREGRRVRERNLQMHKFAYNNLNLI